MHKDPAWCTHAREKGSCDFDSLGDPATMATCFTCVSYIHVHMQFVPWDINSMYLHPWGGCGPDSTLTAMRYFVCNVSWSEIQRSSLCAQVSMHAQMPTSHRDK